MVYSRRNPRIGVWCTRNPKEESLVYKESKGLGMVYSTRNPKEESLVYMESKGGESGLQIV